MELLLLILSILPVIVIAIYLYKKDENKEPKRLLLKLFLSGVLSCVIVIIVSFLLSFIPIFSFDTENMNHFELFISVFIGVALVEEICKWIMIYKISYNHVEFDEVYDMILYACFVALGFALLENIFYVFEGGISVGFLRALFAVPGHVWDAIFMGEYLGLAKISGLNGRKDLEKKYKLLSIVIPLLLHGIYDYCLEIENVLVTFVFLVFVVYMYIISIKKIKCISKSKSRLNLKSNYCSNCGNRVDGNYCSQCGYKT